MKKYIWITALLVIFFILLLVSFNKSAIEYTDFSKAFESNKKVQVVGSWARNLQTEYNPQTDEFSFYLQDNKGKIVKVIHKGSQPNNFTIAPQIVVQGYAKDSIFYSNQIITKCPSKYEGEMEMLNK